MPTNQAPNLTVGQRVLVVPPPPKGAKSFCLSVWTGVVVRLMERGKHRGKYEVGPVAGGPTRFAAREEIETEMVPE